MAKEDIIVVDVENDDEFYRNAERYWSEVDPTVNGVLGGFGYISDVDLRGSNRFINNVLKASKLPPGRTRALDCGAGIGRITKGLLVQHFNTVDLVEQNPSFLEEARRSLEGNKRLGKLYACALQHFEPTEKYDLIWCQWVLGHLTDADLEAFLKRCTAALNPNGVIIIKENISADEVVVDKSDSSFTRTSEGFLEIFRKVPLRVTRQAVQSNFPVGLFSVKIFALVPKSSPIVQESLTPVTSVQSNPVIPEFVSANDGNNLSVVIPTGLAPRNGPEMPALVSHVSPVPADVAVASVPTADLQAPVSSSSIPCYSTDGSMPVDFDTDESCRHKNSNCEGQSNQCDINPEAFDESER